MKKPRVKKYTLTLTEHEMSRLSAYADANGVDRPTALHRIVASTLRQYAAMPCPEADKRQLGLFDSVQIDIFNNTCKANTYKD